MSALAIIDAQIAELRASGETGNVENLLAARSAFAELLEASAAAITAKYHSEVSSRAACDRLVAAIARAGDAP